jgi:hypothetical protein
MIPEATMTSVHVTLSLYSQDLACELTYSRGHVPGTNKLLYCTSGKGFGILKVVGFQCRLPSYYLYAEAVYL